MKKLIILCLLCLPVYAGQFKTIQLNEEIYTLNKEQVCCITKNKVGAGLKVRLVNFSISALYPSKEERDKAFNELDKWLKEAK